MRLYQRGNFAPAIAGVASVIVGLFALSQVFIATYITEPTSIVASPERSYAAVGDIVGFTVTVTSGLPVNAYTGVLQFDERYMAVDSISYEPSIASLWAEEPWYARGSGSIAFTGGTTLPGGFTGSGALLTVYFRMIEAGTASVHLTDAQVLQHDGLGTAAPLSAPIETLFTITDTTTPAVVVATTTSTIRVATTLPSPDITNDGVVNLRDVSSFMSLMTKNDPAADFDGDKVVTMKDFAILLAAI